MILALLGAAIADLCGPLPAPTTAPDPADAISYASVADEARTAGDVRVAAIAYRKALGLDPRNGRARTAFDELCRDDRTDGDSGALLAAIDRYRAGDLDAAQAALAAIVGDGGPTVGGAHFFLGLIALQQHHGGDASHELELARRDPAYAEPAASLLPLAHRDGTLAAIVLVEPELDTNPGLLPDTPPAGATTGQRQTDEDLLLAATGTYRPRRWLVFRDIAVWRKQRELASLDFLSNTLDGGIELDRGPDHVAIHADLDYDLLDAASYLVSTHGGVAVRRERGTVALVAMASLRRRDYQQSAESAFTGWVAAADAGAVIHVSPRLDLEVRATGVRELTADPAFSDVAGGVQLTARFGVRPGLRVAAFATGWYARFDGAEPDGEQRRDGHAEGGAEFELDLGDHVLGTCGTTVIGNQSTIDDFDYWKLVLRCGIALAWGGP